MYCIRPSNVNELVTLVRYVVSLDLWSLPLAIAIPLDPMNADL